MTCKIGESMSPLSPQSPPHNQFTCNLAPKISHVVATAREISQMEKGHIELTTGNSSGTESSFSP